MLTSVGEDEKWVAVEEVSLTESLGFDVCVHCLLYVIVFKVSSSHRTKELTEGTTVRLSLENIARNETGFILVRNTDMLKQFTFQSEVPTKQGLLTTGTYGLVYNELRYAFSCYSTVFISESRKFMLSRECVLLIYTASDSNSYSYAMLHSNRLKNHTPLPAPETLRVAMGGSTTAQHSIVLAHGR